MKHVKFSTILLSFVLALTLQLYPWSDEGVVIRPDFLLVVALYWLLHHPNHCNIGWVWFAGMLVDLATGSLLGQHGMSFAMTAYAGLLYQRRMVLFNRWQVLLYVLLLFGLQRVLILMLKLFAGSELPEADYYLPVFTDLLLWKVLTGLFGEMSRPKVNV